MLLGSIHRISGQERRISPAVANQMHVQNDLTARPPNAAVDQGSLPVLQVCLFLQSSLPLPAPLDSPTLLGLLPPACAEPRGPSELPYPRKRVFNPHTAVMAAGAAPSLLRLPSSCLLAIMQHCCDDLTRCSAARAHSSLRSAAAAAMTSITLQITHARRAWSLLLFLRAHGEHVRHLHLSSDGIGLKGLSQLELPPSVQLESLSLECMRVSVSLHSAGQGSTGVLTGQSFLRKLGLKDCIIDTPLEGLAVALRQLPALVHLCIAGQLHVARHPCDPEDLLPFPGELTSCGLSCCDALWCGTVFDRCKCCANMSSSTNTPATHCNHAQERCCQA